MNTQTKIKQTCLKVLSHRALNRPITEVLTPIDKENLFYMHKRTASIHQGEGTLASRK